MYLPSTDNETTTLTRYLEMQLDAIRDAGYGLTDEQLRTRSVPSSELTLGGLMKHAMYVMCGALCGAGQEGHPLVDTQDFFGSFTLPEDVTGDELRAAFEDVKTRYVDLCSTMDVESRMPIGPLPWIGVDEPIEGNLRWIAVHHVEEFARHAGHADLLREAIDGAKAMELNAAVEGRPANDFVTPWAPRP